MNRRALLAAIPAILLLPWLPKAPDAIDEIKAAVHIPAGFDVYWTDTKIASHTVVPLRIVGNTHKPKLSLFRCPS